MEIRFFNHTTGDDLAVTRHMYHVPRKGDVVNLTGVIGLVGAVIWYEEWVVVFVEVRKD